MIRQRNWLIYLWILMLTGCTAASIVSKLRIHSIEGKVVDNNGKPIRGAGITTSPPSASVLTDDKGNYKIRKLTAGEYIVHASKLGFADESVTVVVGGYDYPTQADIQLLPEGMIPEEPVPDVSAIPTEEKSTYEEGGKVKEKSDADSEKEKSTQNKKKKWWE